MDTEYKQQLPKHEKCLRSFVERVEEFSILEVSVAIRRQELTPENGFLQALLRFQDRKFKSVILFIDEADLLSAEILQLCSGTSLRRSEPDTPSLWLFSSRVRKMQ